MTFMFKRLQGSPKQIGYKFNTWLSIKTENSTFSSFYLLHTIPFHSNTISKTHIHIHVITIFTILIYILVVIETIGR